MSCGFAVQFVVLRSHLGDSTAAHSFNADPNEKGTQAILAKAAQEVSYSEKRSLCPNVLSHDASALFDCFYSVVFGRMSDLPIFLSLLFIWPIFLPKSANVPDCAFIHGSHLNAFGGAGHQLPEQAARLLRLDLTSSMISPVALTLRKMVEIPP
jgi:hypothetical protein